MPCKPSDLSITPPDFDEPSIPGFGTPTVDTSGLPNVGLPDGFPENLQDLIDALSFALPSGIVKPNLSPNIDKTILDVVVKYLDYLTVFLSMYRFILPVLNMILCIIEVLCALTNPFKLIKALRRLFRTCIPDFLALFPQFAIVIIIISLILLIIALIEYIISEILRIVEQILNNLKILARVAKRQDKNGLLAGLHKIGAILCLLQNIISVLQVVAIIIQIIKDIMKLGFRIPPCDDSNQDDDGCCTSDVCPDFIKNGNYRRLTGTLQYFNQVVVDSGFTMPSGFGPFEAIIRQESWQLYDPSQTISQAFWNMTQPHDVDPALGLAFFPQGVTYTESTFPNRCAYTVFLRLFWDPTAFGVVDPLGARYLFVANAIVQDPPKQSALTYDGYGISQPTGVINLIGGRVFEDDKTTPVMIDGVQATINKLLHLPKQFSESSSDGYAFTNVDYTFAINHGVLVGEYIITLGCVPDLDVDKQTINGAYASTAAPNFAAINNLLPKLPDPTTALACVTDAITKLRTNVTVQSVAQFQSDTSACLSTVLTAAKDILGDLVDIGFSASKSGFTIDPNLQFTSAAIKLTAILNDTNGVNMCQRLPQDVADTISEKLIPEVSFGDVSVFVYDGISAFNADITSTVEGTGEVKVKYNNSFFNTITIPTSLTDTPTITLQSLSYEFIHSSGTVAGAADGKPRRDEGDVAGDSSE